MKKKILLLAILGVVVAVLTTVAIIWGPGYLKTLKALNEKALIKTAEKYFISSNAEDVQKAIPILEKILKSPSSKTMEVRAKVLLARTYLKIENADPLSAALLFKEVALNVKYPIAFRAMAARYGADMCDKYGEEFIKENAIKITLPEPTGNTNICSAIRNYSAQLYKSVKQ